MPLSRLTLIIVSIGIVLFAAAVWITVVYVTPLDDVPRWQTASTVAITATLVLVTLLYVAETASIVKETRQARLDQLNRDKDARVPHIYVENIRLARPGLNAEDKRVPVSIRGLVNLSPAALLVYRVQIYDARFRSMAIAHPLKAVKAGKVLRGGAVPVDELPGDFDYRQAFWLQPDGELATLPFKEFLERLHAEAETMILRIRYGLDRWDSYVYWIPRHYKKERGKAEQWIVFSGEKMLLLDLEERLALFPEGVSEGQDELSNEA